jgi:putative transposase
LDGAFQNFFAGRAAYPQARRKDGGHDRFRFPDPAHIRRENDFLHLPKLGAVRVHNSFKRIRGTVRSVTVSRRGKHWYASVLYRVEKPVAVHPYAASAVGLDRNCGTNLCALSTGELVEGVTPLRDALQRLARLQRGLGRKKKGSANFRKAKAKVCRCHERIANIRSDLLHKLSARLSKSHATVVVESLRVADMTASAGGTVDDPGSKVRQKAGLNRSILDRGWGELVRQLRYKLDWRGGRLIEVNAAYTSQRCHGCGHVAQDNRKDTRFVCVSCGHRDHADVNAARNILTKAAGLVASACGGQRISAPVKQERDHAVRLPALEGLRHAG